MLKNIHIFSALISFTLFFIRGLWVMRGSAMMQQKWVRIVPHINDTILLGTAIALTISIGQYPFVDAWLTVKLFALVAYICLGIEALHLAKTHIGRSVAWLSALIVFLFIVSVALTKAPFGFLYSYMV
ncbi:MAG: SirB2 family protein [Gammaproteobacteria bacterium]|nr:SirB2 family protein [Gammaproteobacteria bacterium]